MFYIFWQNELQLVYSLTYIFTTQYDYDMRVSA